MQGKEEIETGAFESRAARSLLNHPVFFVVKATGQQYEAECSNVSATGMFLKSSELPDVGSDISFRFLEQGIVLIQGEARVARQVRTETKTGIGLFFTSLDPLARRMIDRVVALNADEARAAAPPPVEAPADPELTIGGLALDMD